jgi:hypothetical protein
MVNYAGATSLDDLPRMPAQHNDPRIINEIVSETKSKAGNAQADLIELIKEPIIIIILYIFINSNFAETLMAQHLASFMQHVTIVKAVALGALFLVIKKFLL